MGLLVERQWWHLNCSANILEKLSTFRVSLRQVADSRLCFSELLSPGDKLARGQAWLLGGKAGRRAHFWNGARKKNKLKKQATGLTA